MNTEEFKLTRQRLQKENGEFFNKIYNLIQHAEAVDRKAQERYDEGYQKGLDDAWELARKLLFTEANGGMSLDEITECFGSEYDIARSLKMDVADAKAKYDAWKEKKEQEEQIHVGDVVDYDGCEYVVIKELYDFYGVINPTNNCSRTIFKNATKTGKHYDLPWLKKCQ